MAPTISTNSERGRPYSRSDLVGHLRRAWMLAAHAATGTHDLGNHLVPRLDGLDRSGRLTREELVFLVDSTAALLRDSGQAEVEPELTRRLLRSALEYLLAVDADAQLAPPAVLQPAPPGLSRPVDPVSAADPGYQPAGGRSSVSAAMVGGDEATATLAAQVEVLLRGRRHSEAADLLRRRADDGSWRGLAAIAIDAGDRCRADGQPRAASTCYLAAWSADRVGDVAIWRLAELAMEMDDRDLCVSYLDRLAAVLQWRGDTRGVVRMYRKMAILAPDRGDIRGRLQQSEAAAAL